MRGKGFLPRGRGKKEVFAKEKESKEGKGRRNPFFFQKGGKKKGRGKGKASGKEKRRLTSLSRQRGELNLRGASSSNRRKDSLISGEKEGEGKKDSGLS